MSIVIFTSYKILINFKQELANLLIKVKRFYGIFLKIFLDIYKQKNIHNETDR